MGYGTVVRRITEAETRRRIARAILEALPDWFGIRESREEYIKNSGTQTFFAAYRQERPVGFLCLKETGKATAELAVMGVLPEYHRQGIGKALFDAAEKEAVETGYQFLQVKTVAMGHYEVYDRTNRFYQSMGFQEFEVFPELWDKANPCQIYVMGLEERQKTEMSQMERKHIAFMPEKKEIDDFCEQTKAGKIVLRYEKRYVEFDESGSYLGYWRLHYEDPEGAMAFLDKVLRGCDEMLKREEGKAAEEILNQICRLEWTAISENEEDKTDFTVVTACRNNMLSMTLTEIAHDWGVAIVKSRKHWEGRELAEKLLELLNEPICEDWNPVELLGGQLPSDLFSHMIRLLEEEIEAEWEEVDKMPFGYEFVYPEWRLKKDIERKQELISEIRSKCPLPEKEKGISILAACWKQIKELLTRLSYEPYIDDQPGIDEVWEICEALIKRGGLEQEKWQLRRRILKELVENNYYDDYGCYDPLHALAEHFCTNPQEYLELADIMENSGYEWKKAADLYLKYGRDDKYVDILESHLSKESEPYVNLMNYFKGQGCEDEARCVAEQCLEKCRDELTDIFIFLLTDAKRNGQEKQFRKYYNSAKRRRGVDMGRLGEALRKEPE